MLLIVDAGPKLFINGNVALAGSARRAHTGIFHCAGRAGLGVLYWRIGKAKPGSKLPIGSEADTHLLSLLRSLHIGSEEKVAEARILT
jgi:hypothetical protein